MYLKLVDGPMDGATYACDEHMRANVRPSGIWFAGVNSVWQTVRHEYECGGHAPGDEQLPYQYVGAVGETPAMMRVRAVAARQSRLQREESEK